MKRVLLSAGCLVLFLAAFSPQPAQPAPRSRDTARTDRPLMSSQDANGNSTATYKNPDGSYSVIERDKYGNITSEKKFGGASGASGKTTGETRGKEPVGGKTATTETRGPGR